MCERHSACANASGAEHLSVAGGILGFLARARVQAARALVTKDACRNPRSPLCACSV